MANVLAACLRLLLLAVLALAGWAFDGAFGDAAWFQTIFEAIGYAAVVELLIGGFFFGRVTCKVAKYP